MHMNTNTKHRCTCIIVFFSFVLVARIPVLLSDRHLDLFAHQLRSGSSIMTSVSRI